MSAAEHPAAPPARETLDCPSCGEPASPGSRFCEACGTPLTTPPPAADAPAGPAAADAAGTVGPVGTVGTVGTATTGPDAAIPAAVVDPDPELSEVPTAPASRPCPRCGGSVAADGYCTQCGEPAASERDHWSERPAPWVAGVCDRGIRHSRNEDAMALHALDDPSAHASAVLVVCDGVSSAPDSDVASLAAARAARDLLADGGRGGRAPVEGPSTARMGTWSARLADASRAANDAILATVGDMADRDNPPSCTFAAAVVDGPLVVAGWVGDSRVYWIPDEGEARQLSVDDSWAQEMMAQGIPRTAAESFPQAHAITRWLGPDAPDPVARTVATVLDRAGWLMVCSDGLWNYCSPADDLAALLHTTQESLGPPAGTEPRDLAAALVRWANAQGGRDNITVTLARLAPPGPPAGAHEEPAANTR